jgi:hypothetical protein
MLVRAGHLTLQTPGALLRVDTERFQHGQISSKIDFSKPEKGWFLEQIRPAKIARQTGVQHTPNNMFLILNILR